MLRFILKRLLAIIPVVLGVLLIVFSVMRMAPGDPAMAALGNRYTEEQYEAKKEELGLDRPFLVQFADYVVGVVTRFDLGTSYKRQPFRQHGNSRAASCNTAGWALPAL